MIPRNRSCLVYECPTLLWWFEELPARLTGCAFLLARGIEMFSSSHWRFCKAIGRLQSKFTLSVVTLSHDKCKLQETCSYYRIVNIHKLSSTVVRLMINLYFYRGSFFQSSDDPLQRKRQIIPRLRKHNPKPPILLRPKQSPTS